MQNQPERVVLDRDDLRRTLVRIAHEIVEKTGGSGLAVVGIHRRGAVLAQRVRDPPQSRVDFATHRCRRFSGPLPRRSQKPTLFCSESLTQQRRRSECGARL